jgi:rhodanese-related sulfurtransferase
MEEKGRDAKANRPGLVHEGLATGRDYVCQPRVFARTAERLADLCRMLYPGVPSLAPGEFVERSTREDWIIIDARSPTERGVSIIPGALSLEGYEMIAAVNRDKPVLVYDIAGYRSSVWVQRLQERGIDAHSLAGGLLAWTIDGRPLVTEDGSLTYRVAAWDGVERALPPGYQAIYISKHSTSVEDQ